jgi:hypothetical protein
MNRESSKAAYNFNLELAGMVRKAFSGMSDQQLTEILGAYAKLMQPSEQTEMTVGTDVLAQLALLASKAIAQELVYRRRS